ncbi:penicillin-binding transpeptidase domain-containing protein [Halpernia sp. GG3]
MKPVIKEVMNELYAYTMIDMMKGVTEPGGTAFGELTRRGVSQSIDIAAKTGTTQNNSDGWFMGITPKISNRRLGRSGKIEQLTLQEPAKGREQEWRFRYGQFL